MPLRFPLPLQRDTVLAVFENALAQTPPDDPLHALGAAMIQLITHMHEDAWVEWAPRLAADLNAFLARQEAALQ